MLSTKNCVGSDAVVYAAVARGGVGVPPSGPPGARSVASAPSSEGATGGALGGVGTPVVLVVAPAAVGETSSACATGTANPMAAIATTITPATQRATRAWPTPLAPTCARISSLLDSSPRAPYEGGRERSANAPASRAQGQ